MTSQLPQEHLPSSPAITDQQLGSLFGSVDNKPIFDELVHSPSELPLAELTAAYYLRPSYQNGSPPPEQLPLGHPLADQIIGMDVSSLDDPTQKYVFEHLQLSLRFRASVADRPEYNDIPIIDEPLLAAFLVPDIIRAHGPAATKSLVKMTGWAMLHSKSRAAPDIMSDVLFAAGSGVALAEEGDDKDTYSRLALVNTAQMIGNQYLDHREDVGGQQRTEISEILTALRSLGQKVLVEEAGLNGQALEAVNGLLQSEASFRVLASQQDFTAITESVQEAQVSELFVHILPERGLDPEAVDDMLRSVLGGPTGTATERLTKIAEVLGRPDYVALVTKLDDERLSAAFTRHLFSATDPTAEFTHTQQLLSNGGVEELRTNLDKLGDAGAEIWQQFAQGGMYDPVSLDRLVTAIHTDTRLKRLLRDPSAVLPQFMHYMKSHTLNPDLFGKAIGGTVTEIYAQASKLTDPTAANHYLERLSVITEKLASINSNPELVAVYESFLDNHGGSLSPKAEERALQVFSAMQKFGLDDLPNLDPTSPIEAFEEALVVNFGKRLIGEEYTFSAAQVHRLIGAFGSIGPLLTYSQKFLGVEAQREALSELVRSVAEGTYEDWHRGDGSEAGLERMKDLGYLPRNMALEQYQEWVQDEASDSLAQLISSTGETAAAIRQTVALGSIDIDIIAPHYSLDVAKLSEIIVERNKLGEVVGKINQAIRGDRSLKLEDDVAVTLAAELGHLAELPKLQSVLAAVRGHATAGTVLTQIEASRQQLEQLRLLIRIANVSPEEVARNALLTGSEKGDSRRIQQTLDDVLQVLSSSLPEELKFIPESVTGLLNDFRSEKGVGEILKVEDTIDPKVTLEIGAVPQRSCQHYETGGYNEGLIGYFGPDVKMLIVRNHNGGIIARSILRVMEDQGGNVALYAEPIYRSVVSQQIDQLMADHAIKKAELMGATLYGPLAKRQPPTRQQLTVKTLKMPAVYSDSASGINRGSLTIQTR